MYNKKQFEITNKPIFKQFKPLVDIINSKDKAEVQENIKRHLNILKDYFVYVITSTGRYFDGWREGRWEFCKGVEEYGVENIYDCWNIPELRAKAALNAIENNKAKCYLVINQSLEKIQKKDISTTIMSNEKNFDEISGVYPINDSILYEIAKDLKKFIELNESKPTFKDLFNF